MTPSADEVLAGGRWQVASGRWRVASGPHPQQRRDHVTTRPELHRRVQRGAT